MEMRTGNLWKSIFLYSVPLMFTSMLQVLFNIADVAVVGKFAGSISLGAVGSTTLLIALTTAWLIGISNGVNALPALFIGAEEKDNLFKSVHTGFLLCLFMGLLILGLGEFLALPILSLMGTKQELIFEAVIYFKIYMIGAPALALYNYGNAVLSAAGETKKPLKYLTVAGGINVILNLIFVLGFGMKSEGAAIASVIAQYISAFLVLRALIISKEDYRLVIRKISCDGIMLLRLLKISIPAAMQHSLFAIANLFVQSAVNTFDHITVEGNAAATSFDAIVYGMMAACYTACTSFIAQNYGAGNKSRIGKSYFITTIYSFGVGLILGLLLLIFDRQFLLLFTSDEAVIKAGVVRISIMALSYGVSAFMDNATAACQGLGKTVLPTIIVIVGAVVYRVIWIYTVFAHFHTQQSLYLLYVFSWTFTAFFGNIYFFRLYRKVKREL